MMISSRLLLCSVFLFGFIDCKRYFTDTKPDADSLHVKTDHKILAELGDYEIQQQGDYWNEIILMRCCITEAEENRLNHTVKNIKIRSGWNAVCTFIICSEYIRGCECTVSSVSFQMSHGNKAAVVKSFLATVFTEGSQKKK